MNDSLNEKDGFRKQAVPTLVYKYFAEMKAMFINVRPMIKTNGLYGLVVGHNKTTLGGTEYNIDIPYLLSTQFDICMYYNNYILKKRGRSFGKFKINKMRDNYCFRL